MSADSQIALALIAALDDQALDLLAELLTSRLGGCEARDSQPVAYTVATLAGEIGLSERVIRAEIHRGALPAVKRGRSYVITRDAVEAWAAPGAGTAPGGRPRGPERSSRGLSHRPVMASALARLDTER